MMEIDSFSVVVLWIVGLILVMDIIEDLLKVFGCNLWNWLKFDYILIKCVRFLVILFKFGW